MFTEEPAGAPSHHAIVLAHGFNASDTNQWSFNGVAEALGRDGHVVHKAVVAPFRGVPDRAKELAKHVDLARSECKAKPPCDPSKVHLLAHSMGGLDARYLVSKLQDPDGTPYAKIVTSVTTISTPHRGSAIGDAVLKVVPGVADPLLDALAGLWARTFTERDLADGSDLHAAFVSLSEANAPSFNADVQNMPGVFYQSWAGITGILEPHISQKELDACGGKVETQLNRADNLRDHDPLASAQLTLFAPLVGHGIGDAAEPNDAMVTVASAKWGLFNGCIPADHMDEVGQRIGSDRPAPGTGFDHIRFYRRLAFALDAASASAR
jgi:triacylglycerol lipase